jgi:hypothetical protein
MKFKKTILAALMTMVLSQSVMAQTDDLTISVRADRLQTKEGGSTVYTAGLVYKF